MKDYKLQARRAVFGLAAMAMSTLTIGALVVLPARIESEGHVNAIVVASHSAVGPCVTARPESQSWETD
jgi:hypothetical protein